MKQFEQASNTIKKTNKYVDDPADDISAKKYGKYYLNI